MRRRIGRPDLRPGTSEHAAPSIRTRSVARLIVLTLLVALTAGCGAATGGGAARFDTKLITTEEMDASGHTDAFSLVQALRPQWLRVRGRSSIAMSETVWIYLDGAQMGGPNHLRNIATHTISSLHYLDGIEASQRWGLDHGAGAIVVTTRGRQDQRYD